MIFLKRFLIALILSPIILGALYLLIAFNWSFSDGDRVGYLQKFSRKGWFCKTYEGELAMTTVPGVAPVLWRFTVWDPDVARNVNDMLGEQVVLHYREYHGLPSTCFGETEYFVDSAKKIGDRPVHPSNASATPPG
jgi:hypothetical protein